VSSLSFNSSIRSSLATRVKFSLRGVDSNALRTRRGTTVGKADSDGETVGALVGAFVNSTEGLEIG
jgi:hypothetical protein